MPKTKYEVDPYDGLLICTVCGWEQDDVEDDPEAHEEHHVNLRRLTRKDS